jgi:hypothetical protein
MAHTLQERYAKLVDAKLRKQFPILSNGIFNTKYEGNPKAGAVKIPIRNGEVVAGAYNKLTGKALTAGATTYSTLTLDNDIAVNEIVDGFDAEAVPDNLIADRLDSAAYTLGLDMETFLTGLLEAQGTTDTNTVLSTTTTIYQNIVAHRTFLSTNDVPLQNRYIIVSPETYGLLLRSDEFQRATEISQGMLMEGAVGRIAGFDVFESNLLDANTEFITGHNQNSNFVKEWMVSPTIQNLTNEFVGSSAVQGRQVYGALVTKATTVYVKTFV